MSNKIQDKIKEGLQKVLKDIDKKFNDPHYRPIERTTDCICLEADELDNDDDDDDAYYNGSPYLKHSWAGADWYCIRCGHHLLEIAYDDKKHPGAWKDMKSNGTLDFLCSNDNCVHSNTPLTLHHPVHGIKRPAGDSYSISWIK